MDVETLEKVMKYTRLDKVKIEKICEELQN